MTKIMTPSKSMTEGQIDRAVARYRTLLIEHSKNLDAAAVQTVLGQSELADEQVAVFRRRVEMVSNLIIRHVKEINRDRTPQEVLDATGRRRYTDPEVVNGMPKGEGAEAEVVLFKPEEWEYTRPGFMSDDDLEKSFDRRNLRPADPYTLADMNRDDPAFADANLNGTHWKNSDGKWCFATFGRWLEERRVDVRRGGNDWDDFWWFAGVRK